jgi:hypothetical protein
MIFAEDCARALKFGTSLLSVVFAPDQAAVRQRSSAKSCPRTTCPLGNLFPPRTFCPQIRCGA